MPRTGTAVAAAMIAAAVILGSAGASGPAPAGAAGDPVLMAAGDVARCDQPHDEETAALIGAQLRADPSTTVAMLGDGVYPSADVAHYEQCYGPSWGVFKERTRPVPGNHDYAAGPGRVSAPGYYGYFGAAAGDPAEAFSSYDLGSWHVVSLNSTCAVPGAGCTPGSPQLQWLEADLAAHPAACLMAYWHHPRFFSLQQHPAPGATGPSYDTSMSAVWDTLARHGADVVLTAHVHSFESFPRQDSTGRLTPGGIREFVVGTGGGPPDTFDPAAVDPHSESRHDQVFGALRMTLHPDGYDWAFLASGPDPAGTVLESGHDSCGAGTPDSETTVTTGTAAPPAATTTVATPPPTPTPTPVPAAGYWMLGADWTVYPFGAAGRFADPGSAAAAGRFADPGSAAAVDIEPTPSSGGYWILSGDGRARAYGDAVGHGAVDAARLSPGERATSLSATPSGGGYWIFTSRGRAFPFGDATWLGDLSSVRLNGPVLDSAPTPSGRGYFMVGADGGIFTFGDALFLGSMGGTRLNAPVESLVPDSDGRGYWLVAGDGGIFAFDAPFRGSMGATRLNRPVTGMVRFGDGYLMVGEDGGIFNFSDRPFAGSLGATPPRYPIVAVAALDPAAKAG